MVTNHFLNNELVSDHKNSRKMDLNFGWLIGVVIMVLLILIIWARVSDQTMMEVIKDIIDMIKVE